jgi:PDGLE domain
MRRRSAWAMAAMVVAIAVGLAAASPWASSAPDGLERVAGDNGFGERVQQHAAPAADYAAPGIDNDRLATGLAGFVGTLVVFGAGYGVALVLRRRAA